MIYWRRLSIFVLISLSVSTNLSGCVIVGQKESYTGPSARPPALEQYYSKGRSFTGYQETFIHKDAAFDRKHILLQTDSGPIDIDFFEQHEKNDSLIVVFPVLAGRRIAEYFAQYFAEVGFDTAIFLRDGEFRKPENVDHLEELLRKNVIRDRSALDFFEKNYAKKQFGSFGISRGAINAAVTAGVDSRLKYNIFALGGSDLPGLLETSNADWAKNFRKAVIAKKNYGEGEYHSYLEANIQTDPKTVASFIDSRNTLMFLSLLDKTVHIHYGLKLRREIGGPKTIFLPTDHYLGLLYTQYVKLLPPVGPVCIFPLNYVETESVVFFQKAFQGKNRGWGQGIFSVFNLPGRLLGMMLGPVF